MTLDEAIKNLTLDLKSCPKGTRPTYLASHKLGIEALKQVKWLHESQGLYETDLLPGETKD